MQSFKLPPEVIDILSHCPSCTITRSTQMLAAMACCDAKHGWHEVAYDVPGKGKVLEARVCRVKNGIAANYIEPYMRRRDPDCMIIADNLQTDKPRFKERFHTDFDSLRQETMEWLKKQNLAVYFFRAGFQDNGIDSVVITPANAGFFALGLALLQGILDPDNLPDGFHPKAVIYVAPPFRHTHFDGKQIVVHNRRKKIYEMFSYNLYPGPSAKKGVYGMLINLGEQESWITAHCATVQVITPYDNRIVIMHEGASGGGKSEILENIHREQDGRILLGKNLVTGEKRYIVLPRACNLRPINDDMALCLPSLQKNNGKLNLVDAEDAWFIRVNHITEYGTDPNLEKMTIHPSHPLLFLNINAAPDSTALIWDHIEDEPGKPCPNPRVIVPRQAVPHVIHGSSSVDVRSFGVRTPLCTKEKPGYGIVGLLHFLPPSLAWLWRLVAPRGHSNPSIVQTQGMSSEGVGSYGPFAPGSFIEQANLLLKQFVSHTDTRYILCPNQHIGAWEVGFMPQWIAREYLARRGTAKYHHEQLIPSRCPLLGYTLNSIMIEGHNIQKRFLRVECQPEVGEEAYDEGVKILTEFFHQELSKFLDPKIDPKGKEIIECCLQGGTIEDYISLIPAEPLEGDD